MFCVLEREAGPPRLRLPSLLAAMLIIVVGLAGLVADRASALGEQCSGESIAGEGSSLQGKAQSVWTAKKAFGFNVSEDPKACNGSQGSGGTPTAAYAATSSGDALHDWGAESGSFFDEEDNFIATDEAPAGPVTEAGTQLNNMKKAVDSDMAVVPVAQTAVAILAYPPELAGHSKCSMSQITLSDLETVFRGTTTNWRQLSTVSDQEAGGDCDQAITRVVRAEGSGATYQLKHFLNQLNGSPLACTGAEKKTWAQLQPTKAEGAPNKVWPRKSDCQKEKEGEGPVTVVTAPSEPGGQGVAVYVKGHPGTMGYAGLPEAKSSAPSFVLNVYNGAKFASSSSGENEANCSAAKYSLPGEWESGENVDWSSVYGADPEIGGSSELAYPICTLTWAVAAVDSTGVFGEAVATTVHDYLAYVVAEKGGQPGLAGNWYKALPANVAEAAEAAISQIGGAPHVNTALCKAEPENEAGVLVCPSGERYAGPLEGSLPAEAKATFESTEGPAGGVSCDKAILSGSFNEDGTSVGGEEGVAFSFGNGESVYCPSTFESLENPPVRVVLENPPYDASKFVYLAAIAPQGAFVLARDKGAAPLLFLEIKEVALNCYYEPAFLGGQVVNGSPTALLLSAAWNLDGKESSEGCPGALNQATSLDLSRTGEEGKDIYVTRE